MEKTAMRERMMSAEILPPAIESVKREQKEDADKYKGA
jgi:hypothetical protein